MYDVAIIGAGPVGLLGAALLAQSDLDVVLIERWLDPFGLPRAIRMDHEAMRIWQELGIADRLLIDALPVERYDWYGADGELIVTYDMPRSPSGWAFSYTFYQPELEAALQDVVDSAPTVALRRGVSCTGLTERGDHVAVDLHPFDADRGAPDLSDTGERIQARYLIGADGARSTVRSLLDIPLVDAGFGERWFVVDVLPRDREIAARFDEFPMQFCEPGRPYMLAPNGQRHRRWEFMLLDDEDAADYERPERVWSLLEPWLAPGEATIVRGAVYEFRAAVADSLRGGHRCFLIGDAGHRMPPHLGEGLCSGLRDAKALAWRLALVLRGAAGEGVLDSYSSERLPHARALVEQSLAMGKVSCERDPAIAAERDQHLRAAGGVQPWPFPALGPGLGHADAGIEPDLVGQLSIQGHVANDGRSGRLDEVVGRGFVLTVDGPGEDLLSPDVRAAFAAIGGRVVPLGEGVDDVDGRLTAWIRSHGAVAVLTRPDYYVFGAVSRSADVTALVEDLLSQVEATRSPATRQPETPRKTMSTIAEGIARPEGPGDGSREIRYAQFHHNNFFTTRLEEMKAWYGTVLGMTPTFEFPMGAWMTNDRANHRVALTAIPRLTEDADKRNHARLHHQAFEFASFDDLNDTYVRLRGEGIVPRACLDHGMTFSYYYADPDFNYVELQIDNFGDWDTSSKWMHESSDFAQNPIGAVVDPDMVASAYADGVSFEEIRRRVWETDDFRPDEFPDMGGPEPHPDDPPLPVKW